MVNARDHRATRRAPVAMLADERQRLHRLPDVGYTCGCRRNPTVVVGLDQVRCGHELGVTPEGAVPP